MLVTLSDEQKVFFSLHVALSHNVMEIGRISWNQR